MARLRQPNNFYRAALYARGLSYRKAVRPSVTRVNCDKKNESSADILTLYERSIHLVFRHEEWLVEDDPFYLKFWAKLTLLLQKRQFSIDIRS